MVAVAMILQELWGTLGRDFRVHGQVLDIWQRGIEQGSLFECLQGRTHGSMVRRTTILKHLGSPSVKTV